MQAATEPEPPASIRSEREPGINDLDKATPSASAKLSRRPLATDGNNGTVEKDWDVTATKWAIAASDVRARGVTQGVYDFHEPTKAPWEIVQPTLPPDFGIILPTSQGIPLCTDAQMQTLFMVFSTLGTDCQELFADVTQNSTLAPWLRNGADSRVCFCFKQMPYSTAADYPCALLDGQTMTLTEMHAACAARAPATTCEDWPPGWVSSSGINCSSYEENSYCTRGGGYGVGWQDTFGSFDVYGVDGISPLHACCACGGGAGAWYINDGQVANQTDETPALEPNPQNVTENVTNASTTNVTDASSNATNVTITNASANNTQAPETTDTTQPPEPTDAPANPTQAPESTNTTQAPEATDTPANAAEATTQAPEARDAPVDAAEATTQAPEAAYAPVDAAEATTQAPEATDAPVDAAEATTQTPEATDATADAAEATTQAPEATDAPADLAEATTQAPQATDAPKDAEEATTRAPEATDALANAAEATTQAPEAADAPASTTEADEKPAEAASTATELKQAEVSPVGAETTEVSTQQNLQEQLIAIAADADKIQTKDVEPPNREITASLAATEAAESPRQAGAYWRYSK
jgi:hypothetical protein